MTRTELVRKVKEIPELVELINTHEGRNYTNVKSDILEYYLGEWNDRNHPVDEPMDSAPNPYKAVVRAILMVLEQKGLLQELLDEIKG